MARNRLIAVGGTGDYDVFLNVSREEAIRRSRYAGNELATVREIEFDDEFWAYEVSEAFNDEAKSGS